MERIEIIGLNEYIYKGICDNGLEVYVWQKKSAKTVNMTLTVKYGSIHTAFRVSNKNYKVPNGTAHFLEHIKFNEKTGTAHDFYNELGADVNAFTTFDNTSYFVYTNNNVDKCLNHLLDFVQTPYFNQKMINKEKGIIIEEANMGEDRPSTVDYFENLKAIFKTSKYRNLVTGSPKEIKEISLDHIKTVFDTFYKPNNMFLTITGNVNPYEIFELVKQNQSKKTFKSNGFQFLKDKEPIKVNKEYVKVNSKVQTPTFSYSIKVPLFIFKGLELTEILMYTSLIMDINFGTTSDLNDDLLKEGLITYMYAGPTVYGDYLLLDVSGDSKYPDEVINKIKKQFDNLVYDEETFKRKVNSFISRLILTFEDVSIVNSRIQSNIIKYGKIISDTKLLWEKLEYKKLIEISNIIDYNNSTTYISLPEDKAS